MDWRAKLVAQASGLLAIRFGPCRGGPRPVRPTGEADSVSHWRLWQGAPALRSGEEKTRRLRESEPRRLEAENRALRAKCPIYEKQVGLLQSENRRLSQPVVLARRDKACLLRKLFGKGSERRHPPFLLFRLKAGTTNVGVRKSNGFPESPIPVFIDKDHDNG
jgi:hypothetical protein